MDGNIIDKLFSSFADLEKAIESAKDTLKKRDSVPHEIIDRLNSYDGILEKQRKLANELCGFISQGDWNAVSRHVSLINGLSAMIRDDARSILGALSLNSDPAEEEDLHFC